MGVVAPSVDHLIGSDGQAVAFPCRQLGVGEPFGCALGERYLDRYGLVFAQGRGGLSAVVAAPGPGVSVLVQGQGMVGTCADLGEDGGLVGSCGCGNRSGQQSVSAARAALAEPAVGVGTPTVYLPVITECQGESVSSADTGVPEFGCGAGWGGDSDGQGGGGAGAVAEAAGVGSPGVDVAIRAECHELLTADCDLRVPEFGCGAGWGGDSDGQGGGGAGAVAEAVGVGSPGVGVAVGAQADAHGVSGLDLGPGESAACSGRSGDSYGGGPVGAGPVAELTTIVGSPGVGVAV